MFGIAWSVIEWAIDKWTGYKLKSADTALERDKIEAEIERNKDVVKGMVLGQGAFWFQLFFIIPLSLWFSSVVIYSIFWCQGCIWPQPWTIAALPAPLNDWAAAIIGFLFLVQVSKR